MEIRGGADNFRLVKTIDFNGDGALEFTYDDEGRVVKVYSGSYSVEYEYVDNTLIARPSEYDEYYVCSFNGDGFVTDLKVRDSETDKEFESIEFIYSDGCLSQMRSPVSDEYVVNFQWENGDLVAHSWFSWMWSSMTYRDIENNTNLDISGIVSQIGLTSLFPFRMKGWSSRHLIEGWTEVSSEEESVNYSVEYQLDDKGSPVQIDITVAGEDEGDSYTTITITYVD